MKLNPRYVCALGLCGLMLAAVGCAGAKIPRRYHGPVVGNQSIGWESVLHGPEVIVRRVGDGYAAVPDRYYPEYGRRDRAVGDARPSELIQSGAWPDRRLDPVSTYTPPRNMNRGQGGYGRGFSHQRYERGRDTGRHQRRGMGQGGRDFRAGRRDYR